ncbi:alpha/beta hydrolase [Paenibacillus ginsengarvi]|uniref:Alpha/beta fold hydrolase n=1 Tax=Paenibacillus ginsengarvi TaxID=400777 RepID=A0A3B0CH11_9BACL|nr:alpha/beta fold hydrolase [Paenibacillus ginsengarvi]RKN84108.1 alpha/beta fold hydrolase [Paenibacillus ginsengarvi]
MSDKVCLGLHGFTGGPFELTPLARYLENAGWTCLLPTLPGHERPDGLRQVRWNDWLDAAEREAQRLTERYGSFDLVGFSMGGALAAHIASRYPVRRLVLLNAAVIYASPYLLLQDFGSALQAGDWRRYMKIRRTPLRATVQFMRLVRSAKPMWKGIGAPTMIAQSGRDPVVHPHSASVLASLIPSVARVEYFPASKHLICLDREADALFARIGQFLSDETGL